MPTQNPRLTITLKPSLDAAIRRLSELTGQSKSSLIGELLEQAQPVLERMGTIIAAAQTATQEAKERMAANLDEAQSKLEVHLGLVQDLFEEHTADLIGDIEQVGRRKAKGATGGRTDGRAAPARPPARSPSSVAPSRGSRPPRLTGGSHPSTQAKKQAQKTAAKPSTTTVSGKKRGGNA